jgi:3-dehydroquinate dehydratase/shikimate dehydrogenase
MNNGKICASICAGAVDEAMRQIARAESVANLIELRVDCLREGDTVQFAAGVGSGLPIVITYRPKSQGGHAPSELPDRLAFWNALVAHRNASEKLLLDFEYDLTGIETPPDTRVIRSYHDFQGVPDNIDEIYDRLAAAGDIVKIAVRADDVTDTIPLWKLLARAKAEGKPLIPIAMGESGKFTRILGPALGAFMTFAALESGSETAPGQVTASDLRDVYRVNKLDETADIYGILAGDTSYSTSPYLHNAAFASAGSNAVFVPLQVRDTGEFIRRMVLPESSEVSLAFRGFAVTNPHKRAMMEHLDFVDEIAKDIGAVNTVKVERGKLYGYNTDAHGFISPLKSRFDTLSNASVAIIGAGGAARACVYALLQEGAAVTLFARDPQKAKSLADEFDINIESLTPDRRFSGFDILVNTTPLGTKGENQDECVATAGQLHGLKLVYDLVYNPSDTKLIHEAQLVGVPAIGGLEMLIAQGARQFEIWTGQEAPVDAMSTAVRKRLQL